ncbi:Transmembrane amino acid transporter family protein [Rhynchospora pubera]|uniref:Transmembrane amino acid transporter family protein n=1 Tax=Rhynchospora pubera TaxID=906938 RepID=A0AAV8CZA3_9POAL|nr:Transmembrane amino acid transporter family protein [Rhynchospora pubera]
MKNSVSDKNLFIESEDEEDEVDECDVEGGAKDGPASDGSDSSSDESDDAPRGSRPSSYTNQWPQSYRQSIDMYSGVTPPTISFLGTPSLSRLSSSFLTSSFGGKHFPDIINSLFKPLLPTTSDNQQQQPTPEEIKSSQSILIPTPSRKSSLGVIPEDKRVDDHGLPLSRQCTFSQAVLNGVNVLCGVGLLSAPYAIKEGGWLGLIILFVFGILAFYTGLLLRKCLDSEPGLETYPDIGQAAFGTVGRIAISIALYMELYACCVEYIILESDNLSSLFPNAHLSIGGLYLNSHVFFAILTTFIVLPTTWFRDLSVLSYISAGGVIASILVVVCLYWAGLIDHVGFESKNDSILSLSGMPIAIGLYGYAYSGHAVFPNIYSSLKNKEQFPSVLLTSFIISTTLFAGAGALGYMMFGETSESQFTLNLPTKLVVSKVAVWTTVILFITFLYMW